MPGSHVLASGSDILMPGNDVLTSGNHILTPGNRVLTSGIYVLTPGQIEKSKLTPRGSDRGFAPEVSGAFLVKWLHAKNVQGQNRPGSTRNR